MRISLIDKIFLKYLLLTSIKKLSIDRNQLSFKALFRKEYVANWTAIFGKPLENMNK